MVHKGGALLKIQEAIIKKNSLKGKSKSILSSFEFIWDKDNPQRVEKDLQEIIMKAFDVLSQQNQLETKIALRNSQIEVEFGKKKMKLIELIKYMGFLNRKIEAITELKSKLRSYYQEEADAELQYERRKIRESLDQRIDDLRNELREAQIALEKTNWTEEL